MCFRHSNAAKSIPLGKSPGDVRARTMERMRTPYRNPLYWKWTWSIISRPGDRSIEIAAVCACFFVVVGEDCTKLEPMSIAITTESRTIYRKRA